MRRGDSQAALDLLKSTRFQLVHQRYERTGVLRRIEAKLRFAPEALPSWLGLTASKLCYYLLCLASFYFCKS
ncbi:hypothetical protein [Edaphobacter paludis]|uniref:hypothetical protein n=1 Tax=Edaphobacter paludis TaxID=3035702 RepID=UPI0035A0522A